MGTTAVLDCAAGRRLGCATFCCRLIVRLEPDERDPAQPDNAAKHCIDKDESDGLCVWSDRSSDLCGIWERRPAVCRAYDCNQDPLLQVALRDGFVSLTQLVTADPAPPETDRIGVPYLGGDPHD